MHISVESSQVQAGQAFTCLHGSGLVAMIRGVSTLGENIRAARLAAGFEQQSDFARALGLPPSRINDWEQDRYKTLDPRTLLKIGRVAKCRIDQLLLGMDPEYDKLINPPQTSAKTSKHGGVDDKTSSRQLAELETQFKAVQAELDGLKGLVRPLLPGLLRLFKEGQAPRKRRPRRRRRPGMDD